MKILTSIFLRVVYLCGYTDTCSDERRNCADGADDDFKVRNAVEREDRSQERYQCGYNDHQEPLQELVDLVRYYGHNFFLLNYLCKLLLSLSSRR